MRRSAYAVAVLALEVMATWPVWLWYVQRMADGSDEPWGLLALVTAVALLVVRPTVADAGTSLRCSLPLRVPALVLVTYAISYPWVPPIVRAGLAVIAIGATVCCWRLGRSFHLGMWGLLGLSLPLLATLQFYLGYPLRSVTAELAALWLGFAGFGVVADGAVLRWGELIVSVDAPCSGIRMLWVGLYLACALACYQQLDGRRTGQLVAIAVVAVVMANALRAAALFFVESVHQSLWPAWSHDGVGMVLFAAVAGLLAWRAHCLARPCGGGHL